jgi:hypothetical protein
MPATVFVRSGVPRPHPRTMVGRIGALEGDRSPAGEGSRHVRPRPRNVRARIRRPHRAPATVAGIRGTAGSLFHVTVSARKAAPVEKRKIGPLEGPVR